MQGGEYLQLDVLIALWYYSSSGEDLSLPYRELRR